MRPAFLTVLIIALAVPLSAGAQYTNGNAQTIQNSNSSGFVPLAPIPGLTQGATADTAGLANFLNNLYKYLIGLAAALAVIMITWEGLRIATNQDNVSVITDSKGKIYNAIFGLILVLSPYLVFSIINPQILNLSLNLPPLDTKTSSFVGGGTTNAIPTTVDSATGCTVATKGGYLSTATCSSDGTIDATQIAKKWLSSNCAFINNTASPNCLANNQSNGSQFCTQATASCETKSSSSYTLINIGTSDNPNLEPFDTQTSSALSGFISGCNEDGGYVCLNRTVSIIFSTTCPDYKTSLPVSSQKKCYNQSLFCFNATDAKTSSSVTSIFTNPGSILSNLTDTSHNYTCQPTMQFTTQPLQ